jgi:hypothetical protein
MEVTKCKLICVDQGPNMAAWTYKIHLNMCWQNPSHDSEDTKCISTCVDQTPPTTVTTQIGSHHVLTKPLPCQRWQSESQHVLNKPISYQRGQTSISTSFDQTHHTPTSTIMHINLCWQKPIPCQGEHKMHVNMCRPNPSHASEHTKCFLTCVFRNPQC